MERKIKRDYNLEQIVKRRNSGLFKGVTGIRMRSYSEDGILVMNVYVFVEFGGIGVISYQQISRKGSKACLQLKPGKWI